MTEAILIVGLGSFLFGMALWVIYRSIVENADAVEQERINAEFREILLELNDATERDRQQFFRLLERTGEEKNETGQKTRP